MNEPGNFLLVKPETLPRVIFREVRKEMASYLLGQVVKQVGVLVVGNIVEIDEATNDVVLSCCSPGSRTKLTE